MEGYATLRQRATRFLNDNPDVQMVTLKRPSPEKRRVYRNAHDECYGRMAESCPIVTAILQRHLADGLLQIRDSNGDEVDIVALRDAIFSDIHDQVTTKFRKALEETCEQKHRLLVRLQAQQREVRDWIREGETELPPEAPDPRSARGRRGSREVVEVEIDEEDLGT